MKNLFKNIILLSILTLLFGCQTTKSYEDQLDTWKGRSINDLISEWGVPKNNITQPNGIKVYEYYTKEERARSGVSSGFGYGYGSFGSGVSISNEENYAYCKTDFYAENDIIIKWRHEGSLCVK